MNRAKRRRREDTHLWLCGGTHVAPAHASLVTVCNVNAAPHYSYITGLRLYRRLRCLG